MSHCDNEEHEGKTRFYTLLQYEQPEAIRATRQLVCTGVPVRSSPVYQSKARLSPPVKFELTLVLYGVKIIFRAE